MARPLEVRCFGKPRYFFNVIHFLASVFDFVDYQYSVINNFERQRQSIFLEVLTGHSSKWQTYNRTNLMILV